MLRITSQAVDDEVLLTLEGCLIGAWVHELDVVWHDIARHSAVSRVRLDLTEVGHVDDAGRELMTAMYRQGVRFRTSGFVLPELVREIAEAVDGQRS